MGSIDEAGQKGAEEQPVKGLEVLIKTLSNMLETGGH